MKKSIFILAALCLLVSCNKDVVTLKQEENIPEVAERLLGMTHEAAMQYLQTQRYVFGLESEHSNEYVFSRDFTLSEFSYEAAEMLYYGTYGKDTVRYVVALHRSKSRKSASDLYGKWSHYTAQTTFSGIELWKGSLSVMISGDSSLQNDRESYSYCEGTLIDEQRKQAEEDYKNGTITEDKYTDLMKIYSSGRKNFWVDYQRAADNGNIDSANEYYRNSEATGHPKETEITLYMNNGGEIELHYETQNFVTHWVSPERH
ncbi:MAG: hypothetical protein K5660_09475 [Paludibacteraceae bacterium]|nr:hypothetical protein [Paludibacteraceae bacterium]